MQNKVQLQRSFWVKFSIILSWLGIVIVITLVIILMLVRAFVISQGAIIIETVAITISTTETGLELITNSLDVVEGSLEDLETSIGTVQTSVDNFSPIISNVSELIGTDMVTIANEGSLTLSTAAEGSKIIDSTLGILARIPLLGFDYDPETPLHTSLDKLSTNFTNLPEVLTSIQTDLDQSAGDIETLATDISVLSEHTDAIKNKLVEAKPILSTYQLLLEEATQKVDKINNFYSKWVNLAFIGILIVLTWSFLVQVLRLKESLENAKSGKIAS